MAISEENAVLLKKLLGELVDTVAGITPTDPTDPTDPPSGDVLVLLQKISDTLSEGGVSVTLKDAGTIPEFISALTQALASTVVKVALDDVSKLGQLVQYADGETYAEKAIGFAFTFRDAEGVTRAVSAANPLPMKLVE